MTHISLGVLKPLLLLLDLHLKHLLHLRLHLPHLLVMLHLLLLKLGDGVLGRRPRKERITSFGMLVKTFMIILWQSKLLLKLGDGVLGQLLESIWRVCSQNPISPFLSILKYGHHRIIQKIIFKIIPRSLHIKDYFWSYDQKYQKFSYYFLYISAASIANISIWRNGLISFCEQTLHIIIQDSS